jgi:hypothetical protein
MPTVSIVHVSDTISGRIFTVDSGAGVSVVPPHPDFTIHAVPLQLKSASGAVIKTHGITRLRIRLAPSLSRDWIFVVADVQANYLGADFLKATQLLLDVAHACLRTRDGLIVPGHTATPPPAHAAGLRLGEILVSAPAQPPAAGTPTATTPLPPVVHQVQHRIITTGHPVFARARRLDPARYAVARAEFDQLLRLGVIRPSDSP